MVVSLNDTIATVYEIRTQLKQTLLFISSFLLHQHVAMVKKNQIVDVDERRIWGGQNVFPQCMTIQGVYENTVKVA